MNNLLAEVIRVRDECLSAHRDLIPAADPSGDASLAYKVVADRLTEIIVEEVYAKYEQSRKEGDNVDTTHMEVNEKGERSSYGSDIPWLQWALHNAVKRDVKEVLETELLKHKDRIKTQLASMLQKKNSKLINELVEGMAGAMTDPDVFKYRMRIEFDK